MGLQGEWPLCKSKIRDPKSEMNAMNLKTFRAATMADALQQVKTAMGSDAVILHTRTFQRRHWLGLRRREVVEITAGSGLNIGRRRVQPTQRVAAPPTEQPVARQGSNYIEASRRLMQTPAVGNVLIRELSQEMSQLKSLVQEMVNTSRRRECPDVPEELFDYYRQLIENEVAEELASEILQKLHREIRPELLASEALVREKIAEQIEKYLPIAGPIVRTRLEGPHIVALVGPTGVGKTTTIAKLAANLKLREKRRVGLITIDTYRIAAIDQLKKYADIIGSPLRVVNTPEDLRQAVATLQDYEYILIDTAGRSPNDTLKINELRAFLNAANPDEVHLVLSSTASQPCVELAVSRFGDVGVDKIIFTKLDEAAHVGVVLNVVRKLNKGLSYVTTGQDVPDDIEVGRGRRLAQLILGSQS